jgi:hypothetical protein
VVLRGSFVWRIIVDSGSAIVPNVEFRPLYYAELSCFWWRYHNRIKIKVAEGVRFELTRPFGLPVFKTGAINRSATPPGHTFGAANSLLHYSVTPSEIAR